jgi:4-methyl-5(b-hydroxyethyl)-thiazole monophosphate biosynthesis
MKKIVTLLADGFEEVEALTPVDYLRRAGADVTTVATATSSRTVEGSHKIPVIADITLDAYFSSSTELPDAVIVPGGMGGSKNIGGCQKALNFLEQMNDAKKIVAAICAAPVLVLGKTKILAGKKWTCYPGMQDESPAEFKSSRIDSAFVTSENVVTGRGAGAAEEFAMELVRILFGEETKEKIKKATVQR